MERGNINPDSANMRSRTPPWWVAMRGCEGIIRVLLERSNVNPGKADQWSKHHYYGSWGRTCRGRVDAARTGRRQSPTLPTLSMAERRFHRLLRIDMGGCKDTQILLE